MYNTTADYKTYIKKPSRSFESRVKIGSRTLNNSDIIQIVPNVVQPKVGFSIGNTVSQSIDITLKNDGGVYASVGIAEVEIGLKIGNTIEYIPMGTFNIDDVTKTDYTVKFTAYDNMIKFETGYFSSLGDTPTLQEVVNELASITGVEFTGTVPNYTVTKLQGYTCREVLAYVASVCGGNAYITRDGKFTIVYPHEVDCTITADNYINAGYKLEDTQYKVGMITCQNKSKNTDTSSDYTEDYDSANSKTTISVGSLSSDNMELQFENPWVTESILNDIYNKLKDFSYLGYTLKWQGDLSLDPGDIITVTDVKNVTRKAYVYANKLTYTGGLIGETNAKGETKNSNSFNSSGSGTKDIQRISVKLLIAEKAIITKASIKDLKATNARIENLDVAIANIDTALINYAKVEQLDAVKANVANLLASVGNIDSALINKADVAQLNATNANISSLDATVANIQTLIGGNLTIANMQSLVLSSDKVTVNDGFIKNAMIESLDVTKINAGTLNTNKISVSSSDGGLIIAGATQQFKDKDSNVRLQMGQDATGEFSFILCGSDGTSTLIDETGIHEKAIADKLIKTNMVADSAIGEQQINYSSFITGFNKDTNTNYINASKVAIDLTGQTLDIAFNNINTKVDGVKTTTDSNTTSISAIQGQISTLISNTTITKDGTTTQLKDAYNGTVNTINSMATTIGEHTSKINANTGSITSLNSSVSSIKASLTSISASLSSTQSTVSTQATQISTITNTANAAKSAIDNLSVGGRNLLLNTKDFSQNWSSWGTTTKTVNAYKGLTSYSTPSQWGRLQQTYAFEKGKIYTMSAYMKADNANVIVQCYSDSVTSGNVSSSVALDWTRYSFTFTAANTSNSRIDFESSNVNTIGGNLYICGYKLELGNQATDWTPAPEDVDSSIATVNTTATNALNTANTVSTNVANLTTTVNTAINRVSSLELTTSGLSTTVSNVQTAISNLQVGGRNLLYNSGNFTTLNHWGTSASGFYASTNNNELIVTRTGTVTGIHLTEDMTVDLVNGQTYTISMYAKSNLAMYFLCGLKRVSDSGCMQISNPIGDFDFDTVNVYKKLHVTFIHTSDTGRYMLWWSSTGRPEFVVNIRDIKLEVGNQVTDYTPAIEDVNQNIADVKTYATTTISSNVSTINQTTDSIKANVSSLQSSVSTIQTTLGNKADTTTVTAISNRTATLESSVSGINASITTLNSNVSSVTTTANNAKSSIDNLQVGGRNRALLTATSKTGTGFTGTTNYCPSMYTVLTSGLVGNKSVTVSFDFIYTGLTKNSGGGLWIQGNGDVTGWTNSWNNYNFTSLLDWTNGSGSLKAQYTFTISATQMTNSKFYLAIRTDYITGGSFTVSNFKVEQGNTKTDWTPAPEDIDSQITTVNSSVSSLQSSVSVLQSKISLKVEQTNIDSAITTVNNKITTTNATISSLQSSINVQLNSITNQVSKTVSTKNLLKNSSFDEDVALGCTSGTFTNYKSSSFTDASKWLSFSGTKISDKVLFIEVGSSGDWYAEIKNLDVKLTAGKTYALSYYHVERGNWKSGSSFIYFYDSNGNVDFNKVKNVSYYGSASQWDWSRYSTTFTVPDGMVGAYLRFGMWTTGYAWTIIDNVQIEEGSSVTDYTTGVNSAVGSIITQSPTQVMTAFNNISNYFQVSADGAKFGNITSGAYTKMSANGLEHVDSYGAMPYFYLSFQGTGSCYMSGGGSVSTQTVTVNFSSEIISKLNGKVPNALVTLQGFTGNYGAILASGCYLAGISPTSISVGCWIDSKDGSNSVGGYVYFGYMLIA